MVEFKSNSHIKYNYSLSPAHPQGQDRRSLKAVPLVILSDKESSNLALVKRSQLPTKQQLVQAKKRMAPASERPVASTSALAPVFTSGLAKGKGKEVAPPMTSSNESEDRYLNPHPPPHPTFQELEEECGK